MWRRSPVLLVCLCLAAYFGYHAVKGRHGLESRLELSSRRERLEVALAGLLAVKGRLEGEVALLAEANPDPDYVEELARLMLGYAGPGDKVLLGQQRSAAAGR